MGFDEVGEGEPAPSLRRDDQRASGAHLIPDGIAVAPDPVADRAYRDVQEPRDIGTRVVLAVEAHLVERLLGRVHQRERTPPPVRQYPSGR